MHHALRLVLPVLALALTGCVADLADLVTLQKNLLATYPDSEVGVNLRNRSELQITLNNDAAAGARATEQKQLARDIGRMALEQYPAAARLETISVVFMARGASGAVKLSHAPDQFTFTPEELSREEAPAAEEVAERVATAS